MSPNSSPISHLLFFFKDLDKTEEKVVFVEESKTLIKESNTIKDVPKINEVESTKVIKNQKGKEELINLNVHQTKNIVEVKEDSKIGTVATQITSKDLTIEENIRISVPDEMLQADGNPATTMRKILDDFGFTVSIKDRVENLSIAQQHLLDLAKAFAMK